MIMPKFSGKGKVRIASIWEAFALNILEILPRTTLPDSDYRSAHRHAVNFVGLAGVFYAEAGYVGSQRDCQVSIPHNLDREYALARKRLDVPDMPAGFEVVEVPAVEEDRRRQYLELHAIYSATTRQSVVFLNTTDAKVNYRLIGGEAIDLVAYAEEFAEKAKLPMVKGHRDRPVYIYDEQRDLVNKATRAAMERNK